MKLSKKIITKSSDLADRGYLLPRYDVEKVTRKTLEDPRWVQLGAGNIFRAFLAPHQQQLLNEGVVDTGIIVAEGYDTEIIETYKESLKNLGKNGVKVICYNFMPIFDWTRTEMFHPLPDGSTALFFDKEKITSINPQELVEMVEKESRGLTLPGWEPERLAKIKELFVAYEGFTDDKLRENFHYFIDAIMPTCEEYDIKMAIHPDDPPFSIFGLPRLANS